MSWKSNEKRDKTRIFYSFPNWKQFCGWLTELWASLCTVEDRVVDNNTTAFLLGLHIPAQQCTFIISLNIDDIEIARICGDHVSKIRLVKKEKILSLCHKKKQNDVPPYPEQMWRACVPWPALSSKRGVTVILYVFLSRRSVSRKEHCCKNLLLQSVIKLWGGFPFITVLLSL